MKYLALSFALFVLLACGRVEPAGPLPANNGEPIRQAMVQVESYISETKNWRREDYSVKFNRRENTVLIFWVVPRDDKDPSNKRRSVAIYFDTTSNTVVNELWFQ